MSVWADNPPCSCREVGAWADGSTDRDVAGSASAGRPVVRAARGGPGRSSMARSGEDLERLGFVKVVEDGVTVGLREPGGKLIAVAGDKGAKLARKEGVSYLIPVVGLSMGAKVGIGAAVVILGGLVIAALRKRSGGG